MIEITDEGGPQNMDGMIWLPGGTFWMGSDRHYPEKAPARPVSVAGFWIDVAPVTNRQFARFVEETGHVTMAEIAPSATDYPDADPAMLQAGSALFVKPNRPAPGREAKAWWQFAFDVDWRHPWGTDSDIGHILDHPVVHIAYGDAQAYAAWAGKALPSEAEWEYAARGSLDRSDYAWGDELDPAGVPQANYWQGAFPFENLLLDGYERTSPVRSFPPNGFGLYDMIGNVWEWTADLYEAPCRSTKSCCTSTDPRGAVTAVNPDPVGSAGGIDRRVLKGGSHLCAANYCRRYRPAARHPQPVDTSTSHIGFRCIRRNASPASAD